MPAAGHDSLIDQMLAERYHVTVKIGEGGMGSVYKANDLKLSSEVVIKTPHAALIKDTEFASRFRREIRSLVQLSHANIVKVMDVGVHDGLPFAVMQYLSGGSLEDRQRPCDPTEILEWLNDIADALDFMHQRGLIHRDVKPANILLDESGRAYLGDFGIAKVVAAGDESNQKGLTGTGMMVGTGEFMAPEMLMPDLYSDEYNERVDQYALAVTVYEMLAGRPPFRGDTIATVAVKMARTKAPLLHELNPAIPEALSRAVARGLLKKPDRRYPNCRAFAEAVSIAINSDTGRVTAVGVRALTGTARRSSTEARPPKKRRVTAAARTMKEEESGRRMTMVSDEPVETDESFSLDSGSQTETRRQTAPFIEWLKSPIGISSSVGGIVVLALMTVSAVWVGMQIEGVWKPAESPPAGRNSGRVMSVNVDGYEKTAGSVKQTLVVPAENQSPTQSVASSSSSTPTADLPVVAPIPRNFPQVAASTQAKPTASASTRLEKIRDFVGHSLGIRCVAFSQDGKYALSGGLDSVIRLWDVNTGVEVRFFRGHTGVHRVAFSPDGRTAVSSSGDQTVRVWDVASGKQLQLFKAYGDVRALALSSNGRQIISGSRHPGGGERGGTIQIWNIGSPNETRRFKSVSGVLALAISPDGKTVATGCTDGRVEVRDFTTGEVRRIGNHSESVTSIKFMPDGVSLIARSSDGKIRQWDLLSGKILKEMPGSKGYGRVSISPDGKYCLSAGEESMLWDLRSATLIDRIRGDTVSFDVSIGPKGQFALVSVGTTVQLWKLPSLGEQSPGDAATVAKKPKITPLDPSSIPAAAPISPTEILTSSDWTWSRPVNLGRIVNTNSMEVTPTLSADGLTLFFVSDRPGGVGKQDIWVCTRATVTGPWNKPVNLGRNLNTNGNDCGPSLSSDGLTLFFSSDRPGGVGGYGFWRSTRSTRNAPWSKPIKLRATEIGVRGDSRPVLSTDGLTLLFSSTRPGGLGSSDIWMSTRSSATSSWGKPVNLGPKVNSKSEEETGTLSSDGLTLIFGSFLPGARPPKKSPFVLWMSSRPSIDQPFGKRVTLGPIMNQWSTASGASISRDGRTLFFHSNHRDGQGGWDLWMTRRVPK